MADCMKLAEKELYTLLLESVGRAVAAGTLPAEPMNTFKIEVPADKVHELRLRLAQQAMAILPQILQW